MNPPTTTTTTRAEPGPKEALSLVDRLASYDASMTIRTLQVLCCISRNQSRPGGYSLKELREDLGLDATSANRLTSYWAYCIFSPEPGQRSFLDIVIDPRDKRRRLLNLNPP